MRILSAAIVAAFFTAGSVAAYAQDAAPAAKPAKLNCKKLDEDSCKANVACTWTDGKGSAKGKCTKAKKK